MKISKVLLAALVSVGVFAASTVAQAAGPMASDSAKTLHKHSTFGMKKKHRKHHMMKHMMKY